MVPSTLAIFAFSPIKIHRDLVYSGRSVFVTKSHDGALLHVIKEFYSENPYNIASCIMNPWQILSLCQICQTPNL